MIEPKLYKNNQWIVKVKGQIICMDMKFKLAPTSQNLTNVLKVFSKGTKPYERKLAEIDLIFHFIKFVIIFCQSEIQDTIIQYKVSHKNFL